MVWLVHRPGSALPPVCPCGWSNGSNTKTHWTSEELHRALGCRQFCNYKHIIQTSLDGQWIDGGEFPVLLGVFRTIPKAPRGGAIDREQSFYLDIVHVNIAFDDCVSVGGFWYSLVFVDRATRYNWVFGSRICRVPQFLRLSVSFAWMPVPMLCVSGAIVTPNFLGQRFGNILSTMPPTSSLRQRVASHLMASWNRTGRSCSTWPVGT